MKYDFELIRCKRSDPRYQEIRNRHYIPNHGTFGQQMHYLIALNVAGGREGDNRNYFGSIRRVRGKKP